MCSWNELTQLTYFNFQLGRTSIEFDIGKRTCQCQPPCRVFAKKNATYICNDDHQELDYEKLVSSTKLFGAAEGTARVEVVQTLLLVKNSKLYFSKTFCYNPKAAFRSISCLWMWNRSPRLRATHLPPSSPQSGGPWGPGLASLSVWFLRCLSVLIWENYEITSV